MIDLIEPLLKLFKIQMYSKLFSMEMFNKTFRQLTTMVDTHSEWFNKKWKLDRWHKNFRYESCAVDEMSALKGRLWTKFFLLVLQSFIISIVKITSFRYSAQLSGFKNDTKRIDFIGCQN